MKNQNKDDEIDELKIRVGNLREKSDRLQSDLSAYQAREAELQKKLEAAEKMHAYEQDIRIAEEKLRRTAEAQRARFKDDASRFYLQAVQNQQRAEAADAKIKASDPHGLYPGTVEVFAQPPKEQT